MKIGKLSELHNLRFKCSNQILHKGFWTMMLEVDSSCSETGSQEKKKYGRKYQAAEISSACLLLVWKLHLFSLPGQRLSWLVLGKYNFSGLIQMMDLAFHRQGWINMSCPSNPVWFSLPDMLALNHTQSRVDGERVCMCVCAPDYFLAQHFTILHFNGPCSFQGNTSEVKLNKVEWSTDFFLQFRRTFPNF